MLAVPARMSCHDDAWGVFFQADSPQIGAKIVEALNTIMTREQSLRADCIEGSVLVHWTAASESHINLDTICECNEPLLTEIITNVPDILPSADCLRQCISDFDSGHSNMFSKAKKKSQLNRWSSFEGEKLRKLWAYIRLTKRKYAATKTRSVLQNHSHVYDISVTLHQHHVLLHAASACYLTRPPHTPCDSHTHTHLH